MHMCKRSKTRYLGRGCGAILEMHHRYDATINESMTGVKRISLGSMTYRLPQSIRLGSDIPFMSLFTEWLSLF